MKATFSYYLNKYVTILLAPIYYHFGHYSFVLDLLSIGQDAVDTLGLYFLNFAFIAALIFYRNFFFQIFNKFFFKNYLVNKNVTPFLNYFNFFFNNFNKIFNFFYKKFSLLSKFKNKKK